MPGPTDTVLRECPSCSTKDVSNYLEEWDGHLLGLASCKECHALFQVDSRGDLVDVRPLLEKIRLRDDLVSAISPTTVVGESIARLTVKVTRNVETLWLSFLGQLTAMTQQLESRAHFLHGELAKRAMAQPDLLPLVDTAKQIVDIVAAVPDGVSKDV